MSGAPPPLPPNQPSGSGLGGPGPGPGSASGGVFGRLDPSLGRDAAGLPILPPLPPSLPGMGTDPFGRAMAALPFDQLANSLQMHLQAQLQQHQLQQQQQQLLLQQQQQQQAAATAAAAQQMMLIDPAVLQAAVVQQRHAQVQAHLEQQFLQQVQLHQQQQEQQQQAVVAAAASGQHHQLKLESSPMMSTSSPKQQRRKSAKQEAAAQRQSQQLQRMRQMLPHLQQQRPRPRASKDEYIGMACHVCNAPADGMHYGAISCRSCNAFFRRAVSYSHNYVCRFNDDCDCSVKVRCACRACRLRKCIEAGMRKTAVQPPRDPTGSQKDKKKAASRRSDIAQPGQRAAQPLHPLERLTPAEIIRQRQIADGAGPSSRPSMSSCSDYGDDDYDDDDDNYGGGQPSSSTAWVPYGGAATPRPHQQQQQRTASDSPRRMPPQKQLSGEREEPRGEEIDVETLDASILVTIGDEAEQEAGRRRSQMLARIPPMERPFRTGSGGASEYEKFRTLVFCYREHVRMMQLAMTPNVEEYLRQIEHGIILREMKPSDVGLLSTTELSGLLFWIEKQDPYTELAASDRKALFKRYSVRKLSLDHFYVASQWKDECKKGNFVMLNNTYVLPTKTGFELETDDERQITAKAEIFLPTFERMWRCVIRPFERMNITDAEIVALHLLLLWSPLNNSHVLGPTKEVMCRQREWAISMLFEHYNTIGQEQPEVRLGEVCCLLSEIEVICDKHCQDFQVAKLFEFCDMSQYWYEKWCYSTVNTMQVPDPVVPPADQSPSVQQQQQHAMVMQQSEMLAGAGATTMTLQDVNTRQRKRTLGGPSSADSVEDPASSAPSVGGEEEAGGSPRKKAAHERIPSAPSTTPSTPTL